MPEEKAFVRTSKLPPKSPVATEPLRFGIDVDGTISQAPHHFKRLIDALLKHGNEVYIITGRTEDMRSETQELLDCLGINCTQLIMRPREWKDTVAEFKVRMIQERGVHMMFDDNAEICRAVQQGTRALAAHMLPIPEMPEARTAKIRLRRRHRRDSRVEP